MVNDEVIDFSSALLSEHLAPGCDFTNAQCNPNPCLNGGRCIGTWSSFTCDCRPQFAGTTCKEGLYYSNRCFNYSQLSPDNNIIVFVGSKSASFSGNNFISYDIKNPTTVRPLRQTSAGFSVYRTAQNIISFSLATKEDSGTVLQLGDSVASEEYALLEVGFITVPMIVCCTSLLMSCDNLSCLVGCKWTSSV